MATARTSRPKRPCVLPNSESWIDDLRTLDDQLLGPVAGSVDLDGDPWDLPAAPYQAAADATNHLITALSVRAGSELDSLTTPDGTSRRAVYVLPVPDWDLDALWEVLTVIRRALADEPGTVGLAELLNQTAADWEAGPRTAADLVAQLERLLAVVLLDTPAVWTLAAALAIDPYLLPNSSALDAYNQVSAAWAAAGVEG